MRVTFQNVLRDYKTRKGRCAYCLLLDDWLCEKCWTKFQPDDSTGYCTERELRDLVR